MYEEHFYNLKKIFCHIRYRNNNSIRGTLIIAKFKDIKQ